MILTRHLASTLGAIILLGGLGTSLGGCDADGTPGGDGDGGGSGPGPGLVPIEPPGRPTFDETVDTLSIAVRTGPGVNDGTNQNTISLCLSETSCFPMNAADVDDYRSGELDVYHFSGLGLARASIDRVELRSAGGVDAWKPDCLELQLDGEPVYCEDEIDRYLGENELASWRDPDGLTSSCETCYPTPLTHGPMIGAVEPDRARIWVRTDATRTLGLVMTEPGGEPVPVAYLQPRPQTDYAGVFDVRGLDPGTTYAFSLTVDGVPAPGGPYQVTTAPPTNSAGRWSFAFGSCARVQSQPIFATIQALAPSLFLFLGDNHYGNTPDLTSLRWFYRDALERPERAALLARTPTIATWDDHDFVGNNTTGAAAGKDQALRAFGEYWANPSAGLADTPGVFTRYAYGDVEFFMLDDRYWRGLDGLMLGDAQTAWLLDALADSDATFKFIASGSQWSINGSSDSWAAFRSERDALFEQLVAARIEGVVLLSGDIHRSMLRAIPRRTGGYDLPELISSPLATGHANCNADRTDELDQLECVMEDALFIHVAVDTSVADPTLGVTIRGLDGGIRRTWEIKRSTLALP